MKEYLADFRTFAKDLITYEIDNRPDRHDRGESIKRDVFWGQIYEKRLLTEDNEFDSAILSDNNLIFLVAGVGSGKSTFIRHKLEYLNTYNGIIIDFRSKRDFLNDEKISAEETFEGIIKETHLNLLKLNFLIALHKNQEYKDYTYTFDEDISKINRDAILDQQIRKKIAIAAMLHLSDLEPIQNYITSIIGNATPESVGALQNLLSQKISRQQISEIITFLNYQHLVRLTQRLNKSIKPYLIVLDNFERMNYKKFNDYFIESISSMLSKLNGEADAYTRNATDPIIKILFVVRDENISRVNLAAAKAQKYSAITLTDRTFSFPGLAKVQKLPLTEPLAKKIIRNRLLLLNLFYQKETQPKELRLLNFLMESYWLSDEHLYDEYNIFEICNGSLRIMLDVIVDFSFSLIDMMQSIHFSEDEFEEAMTTPFFRSKLLRSLWNNDPDNIIDKLKKSVEGEIEYEYCCLYRIILSYLYNRKSKSDSFWRIVIEINKFFDDIPEDVIKKVVYELYYSSHSFGELIIIDQIEFVNRHDKINGDALIRLTKKGETFVDKLMLNLEFYNIVFNDAYNDSKTIFECEVKDVVKRIDSILKKAEKIANVHLGIWKNEIAQKIEFKSDKINYYKSKFLINSTFHMIRVLSSHKSYIQSYLIELLKGADGKFVLKKEEKSNTLKFNSENLLKKYNIQGQGLDSRLIHHVKTFSKDNPIYWLLIRLERYNSLIGDLQYRFNH